jgi:hypothetical protein
MKAYQFYFTEIFFEMLLVITFFKKIKVIFIFWHVSYIYETYKKQKRQKLLNYLKFN